MCDLCVKQQDLDLDIKPIISNRCYGFPVTNTCCFSPKCCFLFSTEAEGSAGSPALPHEHQAGFRNNPSLLSWFPKSNREGLNFFPLLQVRVFASALLSHLRWSELIDNKMRQICWIWTLN